jgi:hypothetical protein
MLHCRMMMMMTLDMQRDATRVMMIAFVWLGICTECDGSPRQ